MSRIFEGINRLPEFSKDLKKLLKRFPTINDDLDNFIRTQLKLYHKLHVDNGGIFRVSDLGIDYPPVYKVKKFACRSLKGRGVNSGIRIIYCYYEDRDMIEFIEIYFKGDKENEDRNRILIYYSKK